PLLFIFWKKTKLNILNKIINIPIIGCISAEINGIKLNEQNIEKNKIILNKSFPNKEWLQLKFFSSIVEIVFFHSIKNI
ncbi:hypothetical protein, partial [Klebsiella pneumoniae]|uniref:hypothetical protein n=1 Tax=Klebsiella pneumoniae TaxID=573 RepID=UPI0029D90B25